MIIAKQVQNEQVNNEYFELFIPQEAKDIEGNPVTIAQSIGQFSLAQLEQEKQALLSALSNIEDKIAAINELSN
ncbi:hypothetical protein MASR2M39_30230 [Ignavibacteriales bacterium]